MPSQLEIWLQQECDKDNSEFTSKLERIKRSAHMIWALPRLMWYTDHSVKHSERIIDILGQVLSDLQTTPQRLTCQEIFILLAACYLHDIGMQDFFMEGRGMESFTIKDYDVIRKRHPARAHDLIIQRSLRLEREEFRIDLDDQPSYLVPIALVSQGHGSEFFENTVKELSEMPYRPNGRPIRGGLLTALLMIGDELDLHEERARFPKDMALSPLSALHHHFHSYVAGIAVRPGATSKERSIYLSLNYPLGSEAYALKLRDWIVSKLQRQLRRTSTIIEQATNGELKWSSQIEVRESIDKKNVLRPLPEAAQNELYHQTTELEMVDYTEAREAIRNSVFSGQPPRVLCIACHDEQALVQLLLWLEVECLRKHLPIFRLDFRYATYSRQDILSQLSRWFSPATLASNDLIAKIDSMEFESEEQVADPVPKGSWQTITNAFFSALKASPPAPAVLFSQNLDIADSDTVNWFVSDYLPKHQTAVSQIPVVITCRHVPELSDRNLLAGAIYSLSHIRVEDIEAHLRNVFGFSDLDSHERALDIFGTSGAGNPQGVFYALRRMRMKEIRLAP